MKRHICVFLATALVMLTAWKAMALVMYEDKHPKKIREIRITGFFDYEPFGSTQNPDDKMRGKFTTVFQPMIDTFKKENNLKIIYNLTKRDYGDLVQQVRSGEIDMLLGAYHETALYKGLELVYPSLINNPVTIITLPNRVNDVQDINSLMKLKGIRSSKEYYSDFVMLQLKDYNLETVDTSYEMFEKLFNKQVDYIMVSQYYGLMEAIKLGLREHISVAKQMIWKMPMFIGVSKISPQRKLIIQKLTHYSEKPENRKIIEDNLIKMMADYERTYDGVVSPILTQMAKEVPAPTEKEPEKQ